MKNVVLTAMLGLCLCGSVQAEFYTLTLRDGAGERSENWPASETAFIICDTWDAHHSINAVRRMEQFVPRMNEVITKARTLGSVIIHAPSDCMPAYEDHPARRRAMEAPKAANLPAGIERWNPRMEQEEGAVYPLDQSGNVEDDDPAEHAAWVETLKAQGRNPGMPWLRQHPGIVIDAAHDYISDRGDEVWNVLEQRGVKRVVLLGVHANMCVLGRPFGLRNLVAHGKQAVLLRDLTDCMYSPEAWPQVDHFTGNALLIDYIEKRVCATATSDQIVGGAPFAFREAPPLGALPSLPERDPSMSWAPVQWNSERTLSATWARCVVHVPAVVKGGAALLAPGVSQVWLDGAALPRDKRGAFVLSEEALSGNPLKWLVLRADGDSRGELSVPVWHTSLGDTPLSGGWQMRSDLSESDHAKPAMPAQFGASPDMVIEPR